MGPDALPCAQHRVSRRGFSHYRLSSSWLWSPPGEADPFLVVFTENPRKEEGRRHVTPLTQGGWVFASARTAAVGSTSGPWAPAEASRAQWCGLGSLGVSGSMSSSGVRLAVTARLCMASR